LSVNSYELILSYFNNEIREVGLLSFVVTTTFQGALHDTHGAAATYRHKSYRENGSATTLCQHGALYAAITNTKAARQQNCYRFEILYLK